MLKKLMFPLRRNEWALFGLIFLIICLVNVNFTILRSARNALVVADRGGSAAFIPYFELFGTFPASILLTWALSRLMRVFSPRFIFSATVAFFLLFFVVFAFWIYPSRDQIQQVIEAKLGLFFGLSRFKVVFTHWPDMIFYVMSELWKVAILSVVFWGFVNQNLSLDKAKRFYPPLMLGGSIGAILAGPITVFCTSQLSWELLHLSVERWQHALYMLTSVLFLSGGMTILAFNLLFKTMHLGSQPLPDPGKKEKRESFSRRLLSLSSSLRYLRRSPYLTAILLIVVAEYVSYALGELIFLDLLKQAFPKPADYCQYMGNLSFWTRILTAVSALVITPFILQNCKWRHASLITPLLMVLVTFAFFAAVVLRKAGIFPKIAPLPIAVLFGSLHFCIGRSIKYTLFDSTKELAFIPLSEEGQMKGKLIVDGIGSRLGRGTSSLISIALFTLMGGAGESGLFAGIIAITFAFVSLPAARFVGVELERMSPISPEQLPESS